MIKVIDNFFEEGIQKKIWEKMMRPKWSYTGGGTTRNRFWHMDGLEKEKYFKEYLYKIICKKLDKKFSNIVRIYANGQTAGQCGTPHYDDADLTFLYYPAPEWDITWQGHLNFYINREIKETVTYKSNRAVLFSADMVHCAEAPTDKAKELRVSLAYKLLE